MRKYDAIVGAALIGLAFGFPPAASFDGTPSDDFDKAPAIESRGIGSETGLVGPSLQAVPPPEGITRQALPGPQGSSKLSPPTPTEALRSGARALRDGKPDEAMTSFEYAAEQGAPGAMWKLGRMYADGDGVNQDKVRAFDYFKTLTKAHANDPPGTPQARFVASAFVALGQFYLDGIPEGAVKPDPGVAHELFYYAASYFQDPEAQYHLGRLYLYGLGTAKDTKQAAGWLGLAANKGHHGAQAVLGTLLFKGQGVPRQAARGLAWLTMAKDGIAKDGAGPDDAWIADSYKSAFAEATQDEQAMAYRFLEDLLSRRR